MKVNFSKLARFNGWCALGTLALASACGGASSSKPEPDAGTMPTDSSDTDAGAPPEEDAATTEPPEEDSGIPTFPIGDASTPPPDDGGTEVEPPPPTDDAGTEPPDEDAGPPLPPTLAFNEIMPKNDGAWIDETGETDDWIEIVNRTTETLNLSDFNISDASGVRFRLPDVQLQTRQGVVLWGDAETMQGKLHLPFKLDADHDELTLRNEDGRVVDRVEWDELEPNDALARYPDATGEWARCRYATPRRKNGDACVPPAPPEVAPEFDFSPYEFAESFTEPTGLLGLNELGLRPESGAAFIELVNRSSAALSLDDFTLRVSTTGPGLPWPEVGEGVQVALEPGTTLAAGQRLSVEVPAEALADLEADPAFEGVVSVFDSGGVNVERIDFMRWPSGATLTRMPDSVGGVRLCNDATPGLENSCDPLLSRDVGDRVRQILTPGDFEALSTGDTQLGMQSVKFVLDMEAGGVVHLLGAARWPLHYTFIRELIYLEPELDRCDPEQGDEFYQGWVDFSRKEYFVSEGRRFLLGTFTHHGGSGLHAVEYAQGDEITGEQMKHGFFSAVPHTDNPTEWVLHPHDSDQAGRAQDVDGELPIVDPNAPYAGLTYQPLTEGLAYGTLRFVTADQLKSVALGPDVIVVTDDVPNDIPFVGGLITEAFQTPLAHVNVLSQNRGTPNAALKDARNELAPYLEKLVRLEVRGVGLEVELADPAEAQAYWDSQIPDGPTLSPRLDASVRGVQSLSEHGLSSLPAIGAKAAQLAELGNVTTPRAGCATNTVPLNLPVDGFAIPLVHYQEHFENSGAKQLLEDLQAEAEFDSDPVARASMLHDVQEAIEDYPVDAELLSAVLDAIQVRFSGVRIRLRSSSNTEDLPGFNGAGLYTSKGIEVDPDNTGIEDSIREVWASLWNPRAYDERRHARIDDTDVAMGVLVHPAFPSEEANGVAVSRDLLDPGRGDIYYINVQAGEASVTNPAPSVTTEELEYRWGRSPLIMYQSKSSLLEALSNPPATVISQAEATRLACSLGAVHDWFELLLNADAENPWFAMEVEFKFVGPSRQLLIKQARPFSFPNLVDFGDCREL